MVKASTDVKKAFRQAAEIAAEVPESMQAAAFHRALDLLLGSAPVPNPAAAGNAQDPTQPIPLPQPESGFDGLLAAVDSTRYPEVPEASTALEQSLRVLRLARQDHGLDGLTPVEISRVLTEKFRIGTSRQAVGMALKAAANLVNRTKEGRAFRYQIMAPGEQYLDQSVGSSTAAAEAQPRKRSPAGRKQKAKKKAPSVRKKNAKKSSAKKKASKPGKIGPKAAVKGLIDKGFFDRPREAAAVQEHLRKKRGLEYGSDQIRMALLRLVRDEALNRDEGPDGEYEYQHG